MRVEQIECQTAAAAETCKKTRVFRSPPRVRLQILRSGLKELPACLRTFDSPTGRF